MTENNYKVSISLIKPAHSIYNSFIDPISKAGKCIKNSILYYARQELIENLAYNKFVTDPKEKKYLNLNDYQSLIDKVKEKPAQFIEDGVEFNNYIHGYHVKATQHLAINTLKDIKSFIALRKTNSKAKLPNYIKKDRTTITFDYQMFTTLYAKSIKHINRKKFLTLKDVIKLPTYEQNRLLTIVIPLSGRNTKYQILEQGIWFVQEIKIVPVHHENYEFQVVYDPREQDWDRKKRNIKVEELLKSSDEYKSISKIRSKLRKDSKNEQLKKQKKVQELQLAKKKIEVESIIPKPKEKPTKIEKRRKYYELSQKYNIELSEDIIVSFDSGVKNIFAGTCIDFKHKNIKSMVIKKENLNYVFKVRKNKEQKQSELDVTISNFHSEYSKINNKENDTNQKKVFDDKDDGKTVDSLVVTDESDTSHLHLSSGFVRYMKKKYPNDWIFYTKRRSTEFEPYSENIRRMTKDYKHKIANKLLEFALKNNSKVMIFGKNSDMKQKMKGQNWNFIPHSSIIDIVIDKAKSFGINVLITEESYTSKSSFFDMDDMNSESTKSGKRKSRDIFVRSNGKMYHSDLHGSLNIMKKVIEKQRLNDLKSFLGLNSRLLLPKSIHL